MELVFDTQEDFDYVSSHPWFSQNVRWSPTIKAAKLPVFGEPGERDGKLVISDPRISDTDVAVVGVLLADRGVNTAAARARDQRLRGAATAAAARARAGNIRGFHEELWAAEAEVTNA